MLANLGGLYTIIDLLVFNLADYFSAKLFIGAIAAQIYFLKNKNKKPQDPITLQHLAKKTFEEDQDALRKAKGLPDPTR
jgi:hypothetical protein